MEKLKSKDGTQIAFQKSGNGKPLIIVGGALSDHNFYAPLAEELAKDYTVYSFDRRGRGESGDTQPYAVEREVEDIKSLIDATGEPAILYGHSAGSALALKAAAAELPIAALVLVDPPFTAHGDSDEQSIAQFKKDAAKVQELHDKGDHKGNAARFLSGFGLPEEVVEGTLNSPAGAGMISCAKALPHDYAVLGNGLVPSETASQVKVPTFIIAAGYSLDAAAQLTKAIPGAVQKTLTTPTHEMPPKELANVIKETLKSNSA